jgi:polyisoprenoid-binding protein YceI
LPENASTNRDEGPAATPSAVAATTPGAAYTINPMVSRFTVKAFASGVLSAFGHDPTIAIRDLQGEAHFNPDDVPNSSLHLVVRADSLALTDNVSDKDRRQIETEMRDNVLETGRYPEIVYDAPSVTVQNNADGQIVIILQGQLSLHGVTRPQKVPARIVATGEMLRAFGECTLRQTDFNIKPVSAAGGGLKVKDEVKFSFDIVARK